MFVKELIGGIFFSHSSQQKQTVCSRVTRAVAVVLVGIAFLGSIYAFSGNPALLGTTGVKILVATSTLLLITGVYLGRISGRPQPSSENRQVSEEQLLRILKCFSTLGEEINISYYKSLIDDFKLLCDHQNSNDRIVLSCNNFNKLDFPELRLFVVYLVMSGEIFGFSHKMGGEYYITLQKQTSSSPTFTKEKLLNIDAQIQKLSLLDITAFPAQYHVEIERALAKIRSEYYNSFAQPSQSQNTEVNLGPFKLSGETGEGYHAESLDLLKKHGIITHWHKTGRSDLVLVKLPGSVQSM